MGADGRPGGADARPRWRAGHPPSARVRPALNPAVTPADNYTMRGVARPLLLCESAVAVVGLSKPDATVLALGARIAGRTRRTVLGRGGR